MQHSIWVSLRNFCGDDRLRCGVPCDATTPTTSTDSWVIDVDLGMLLGAGKATSNERGYSDLPFARIHDFYTAGTRKELEEQDTTSRRDLEALIKSAANAASLGVCRGA